MYAWLIRPLLFRFDAERVHYAVMAIMAFFMALWPVRTLVRRMCRVSSPAITTSVAGVEFENPIGLAAGFDKNARWFNDLAALGFSHVEVGTITGRAQPGNDRPRLFRLPADKALINRFGFNNDGADAVAARLANVESHTVLGINIGKSKVVPNEEAIGDYLYSLEKLARSARYVTVNVSSPNTKGLRDLQARDALAALLGAVVTRNRELAVAEGRQAPPVFVKIAPDLTDAQIDEIVELSLAVEVSGIIATNTTISRSGLHTPGETVAAIGDGGLSGAPLTARSRDFVAGLYRRLGGRLPIIGVGGIMTPEDAWEMLRAGASAVQLYTGFIYGGAFIVRDMNRYISERCAARQTTVRAIIGEAAGVAAPTP